MTTAVWVILCVLGLMTGFAVGWSRRHRRADAIPSPAAEAELQTPEPAPEDEDHDDEGVEAPVIDLRVLPGEGADDRWPAEPDDDEDDEGDDEDDGETATGASSPRLSLAGATATAVAEPETRTEQPDAQVIDLAAAARPVPLHNLQFVDGIGPRLDKRLRANGIVTVADLAATRRKELRPILAAHAPGLEAEVDTIRDSARSMVDAAARGRVAPQDPGSELRRIQGIGTTMMRWLEAQGITSLAQLAELSKADIAALQDELTDYPGRIRAEKWRAQARSLLA